jgi:transcriptional regulator with XRE-family HTH domain
LTQVELAERLGVSQNRVSRLERGDIERVRIDTLARYVESLGGSLHIEMRVGDARYPLVVAHSETLDDLSGAELSDTDSSDADEHSKPAMPLWQEATTRGR